jgi:hypothetical protein
MGLIADMHITYMDVVHMHVHRTRMDVKVALACSVTGTILRVRCLHGAALQPNILGISTLQISGSVVHEESRGLNVSPPLLISHEPRVTLEGKLASSLPRLDSS